MRITRLRSLALAVVLAALVTVSGSYWPVQDAYHPLNSDWNGCSDIATLVANADLLFSYGTQLPNASALVIIGPSLPFSRSEGSAIRDYLERNGTVLLADDFGSGNSLLEELNVKVRFAGRPLADIYAYSKNPSFPLVSDFSPSPFSRNISLAVLDHPSFLQISNSSDVSAFAFSSSFSFIDSQGVGRPAQNQSVGSYPVMAYTHVGSGSLVLVANAAMFINEMVGLYDNIRLIQNVARSSAGSLILDVAHLANAPLTHTRLAMKAGFDGITHSVQGSVYTQAILIVLVLAVALPVQLIRRRRVTHGLYFSQ